MSTALEPLLVLPGKRCREVTGLVVDPAGPSAEDDHLEGCRRRGSLGEVLAYGVPEELAQAHVELGCALLRVAEEVVVEDNGRPHKDDHKCDRRSTQEPADSTLSTIS